MYPTRQLKLHYLNLLALVLIIFFLTGNNVEGNSQISNSAIPITKATRPYYSGIPDLTVLVTQVSKDNISQHIQKLEGPRFNQEEKETAKSYIKTQLENFGYAVKSRKEPDNENLIAELKGSIHPENIFIIGAHYDTLKDSPGADDNASAVAGMLEIARVLARTKPESTVQFVAFDNEEHKNGTLGSLEYAKSLKHSEHKVMGMISLEMIAYACNKPGCQLQAFSSQPPCLNVEPEGITVGDFIGVVANTNSTSMINAFRNAATKYIPSLKVVSAIVAGNGECFHHTRRSDHAPFWDSGFPALMITDTANFRNPNYHGPTDTLSTLDLNFAVDVVRATLATIVTNTRISPAP